MKYIVYKITNEIDGKIYIGVHKTQDINDSYMGSGKYLINAQKKYGIENFTKEILEVFDTPEMMFQMESILVNDEFVQHKETYNLKLGGYGGFDYINSNGLNGAFENGLIGGEVTKQLMKTQPELFKDYHIAFGKMVKQLHLEGKFNYDNFKGKKHSEESKRKIGEANSVHQQGSGNSMYGSMWIYNLELKESKRIPKGKVPDGWSKGRKIKF